MLSARDLEAPACTFAADRHRVDAVSMPLQSRAKQGKAMRLTACGDHAMTGPGPYFLVVYC
jgi:hypothetical protein